MGLDGKESVLHYIERWDKERWTSADAHKKLARYKDKLAERQRNDSAWESTALVQPVQKPGDKRVAAGAALALAEYDVEGAVSWLASHGPGNDADRRGRTYDMLPLMNLERLRRFETPEFESWD